MTMTKGYLAYVLVSLCGLALGYQHNQERIPNGKHIPHPCKPNYIWHGVGHKMSGGGGARNDFGKDFKKAGGEWTVEFCQMDSDGDGRTNGEELGDPDCVWQKGDLPTRTTNLTHPGVCDPYGSAECESKNSFVDCEDAEFLCDHLNDIDVNEVTVKFPNNTRVPNKETTYKCIRVELPQDGDYHLIASKPYLDNREVAHHMILFGCDESINQATVPLNSPYDCNMGAENCRHIISGWTVGSTGNCAHANTGFRIGLEGFKQATLQIHWNNPLLRDDYVDSSGLTLYYTANRRPYDAGTLIIGQRYLEIPPRQSHVEMQASCPGECTRRIITDKIYVTRAFNHMHYLGRQGSTVLIRNGTKVRDLAVDDIYHYDNPVMHEFDDPIEVLPGDVLKTTCVFESDVKTKTVFYGDGTSDEMCYSFLTFYPTDRMSFPNCISYQDLPFCKMFAPHIFPDMPCNIREFLDQRSIENMARYQSIMSNCKPFHRCLPECLEVVRPLMQHPCMQGAYLQYAKDKTLKSHEGVLYMAAIDSCRLELNTKENECKTVGDSANLHQPPRVALVVALALFLRLLCN